MKSIKYKELYDSSFLDKFGSKKTEIESLELNEESGYAIDVEEIASINSITINPDYLFEDSGSYDSEKKIINVNSLEPEYRQRFTIAHELGHAISGHDGMSYRTQALDKYTDIIERSKEVSANQFAAELLMPKKLLIRLIMDIINNEGWNEKNLDSSQINSLIKQLAIKINVSEISLKYRIKNLRLFVSAANE